MVCLLAPAQARAQEWAAGCSPAETTRSAEISSRLMPAAIAPAPFSPSLASSPQDYRDRLSTTLVGWPRMDRWCVWVEPVSAEGAGARWDRQWLGAVESALARWGEVLPIDRTDTETAAQVRILRRRPPLRLGPEGGSRASHGRAILRLTEVLKDGTWWLEPRVEVLISPGQRALATEATALHELGHAFGLWGHSDEPGDAMAGVPGPQPVLELSPRDRATVNWLYAQPSPFGRPVDGKAKSGSREPP